MAEISLKSLIYQRVKGGPGLSSTVEFRVLDQLLLPEAKIYNEIKGSKDAWTAIRSMQVRGAPLIAIVAVLGLAVEAYSYPVFAIGTDTAESAAVFLLKELEYLKTSRPTAVNLFIATDECSAIVRAAAEQQNATAATVIEAYISAAEDILAKDLISNKAIGRHGALHIIEGAAKRRQGAVAQPLKVLTICNTGSLATAGYGTALGVVRSLFAMNQLAHIYACETRPYNQGARLTAFEIVEDGLPGTLITDSMASALMKIRGVDCVIVGADRIAANGDSANKIGTYQLAIAAKYHSIPFFVAAPTTTIDLSTKNGDGIPIEERPAIEMTSIFGRKIAADGIAAWNPSFDVTPSSLISGIITEVGVAVASVHPDNTDGIIDLPAFLQANGKSHMLTQTCAAVRTDAPASFEVMTPSLLLRYVSRLPAIMALLGFPPATANTANTATTAAAAPKDAHGRPAKEAALPQLDIKEVGDGNLNFVYIVTGPSGDSVVVKQALPYIRVVQSWPLTLGRAGFETRALQAQRNLCVEHVPEVYHYDPVLAVIIMRYVGAPHTILRKSFIAGRRISSFAGHLATFLAKTLYGTSALAMSGKEFRGKVSEWSKNVQLCALTEQVVFTDPYCVTDANRWTTPQLDSYAALFREDAQIKAAAAVMKGRFLTSTQCLVHGDLHSGSVMACEGSTFVIDPEFAFYGPMGFDSGAIVANILLAYFSQAAAAAAAADRGRDSYADWLLQQMVGLYQQFEKNFLALWLADSARDREAGAGGSRGELFNSKVFSHDSAALSAAQKAYIRQLWLDTLGFAAMKMIRRVLGISHVEDLESISDSDARAACEKRVLMLARRMLLCAASASATGGAADGTALSCIAELAVAAQQEYRADYSSPSPP